MIGDKILEKAAAEGHRLTGFEETKVLEKVGHACSGPSGSPAATASRAWPYCLCMMALMTGLTCSPRAIAASST